MTDAPVNLSTIIVSYNTRDLLRDCLASLEEGCRSLTTEIFVVDNRSSDGSADMVAERFGDVILIRNDANLGFAAANNRALDRARGEFLLLLNPDTVVRPGALTELVRFLRQEPKAGYCGPRLVNLDGSHQPSAMRFPTLLSPVVNLPMLGWTGRFPASRHTPNLHLTRGSEEPFRSDWLVGACLLVRSEAARQVGPLDPGFFMYWEEIDWCRRMADRGWTGWYVPSSEVLHLQGSSVTGTQGAELFRGRHPHHYIRGQRRYLRRHLGLPAMVGSVLLQILLYGLIWLRNGRLFRDRTPEKARTAASSIRYLLRP